MKPASILRLFGISALPCAVLALAACQPQPEPEGKDNTNDSCGMSAWQQALGHPIAQQSFPPEINLRAYQTGSALTRDYRQDRLNVEYNAQGVIVRLWCG